MSPRANTTSVAEHAPSLPAVHALHLAEVVARLGVARELLFAGSARDVAELADPGARLSLPELEALVARAVELTGEPGLGFHLGLQMRVSAHGYLGFAAMAAPTLRAALDLAVRYAPTRTRALALRAQEHGDAAAIIVDELAPLAQAAREAVVFALLVGIQRIGSALTGHELDGRAEVAFEEPAYFARFEQVVRGRVRFGCPSNRLVFDARILDLPISLADPGALRLARQACERELEQLGCASDLVSRVRPLLERDGGGYRSLDEVAALVHVSSRTLKRRLAEAGVDFSTLVDVERKDRALLLLASPEPSIESIADRLGYSDVANFARAFRRWTGQSPGAYRRLARAASTR